MFYDFHRTSTGKYQVFATVKGSYGEEVHTQVGRNYRNPQHAIDFAVKLHSKGMKDVAVRDVQAKRSIYVDLISFELNRRAA